MRDIITFEIMSNSKTVYLSTGTNIGKRLKNLDQANMLIEDKVGLIAQSSSVYETLPWGVEDQPRFYNQVLEVETELEALELLDAVQDIEKKLGRIRKGKWAERIIDIDILYYGSEIIKNDRLRIPHKLLHLRNFVLLPLLEIAPNMIHPQFEQTTAEIFENCTDTLEVVKLEQIDKQDEV